MSRRARILIATHVLAFAGACGIAKLMMPPTPSRTSLTHPPLKSKRSHREPQMNSRDQERLMATFGEQRIDPLAEYEKLKETLPVAADPEAAVLTSITEYGDRLEHAGKTGLPRSEVDAMLAVFEVRMLDWMLQDPDKAVDFILKNPVCRFVGLSDLLGERVFKDVIHKHGVIASLSWLTKSEELLDTLGTGAVDEMKAGGGIAFLVELQAAMKGHPFEDEYRSAAPEASEFSADQYNDGPPFFKEVGKNIPFDDKEKLLDFVARQPDEESKQLLLSGFIRSDGRVAPWLLDLIARGVFDLGVAKQLKREIGNAVGELPGMPMDARVEARQLARGDSQPRQAIVNDLVMGDVRTMLDHDRDWRDEFKTGKASLDDVLAAVKAELPNIPADGEVAMRKALFYQLSGEDLAKALPLLDTMTGEMRREILSSAAWESHDSARPDYFLRFLQQMPQPVTVDEKYNRTKGWEKKTPDYLERYGGDYVEWVKQMPPGFDRDAAANSVISSTENPERARRYREQLSKIRP